MNNLRNFRFQCFILMATFLRSKKQNTVSISAHTNRELNKLQLNTDVKKKQKNISTPRLLSNNRPSLAVHEYNFSERHEAGKISD